MEVPVNFFTKTTISDKSSSDLQTDVSPGTLQTGAMLLALFYSESLDQWAQEA
jgi:hypothetical protein